jgi:hypothetical protein
VVFFAYGPSASPTLAFLPFAEKIVATQLSTQQIVQIQNNRATASVTLPAAGAWAAAVSTGDFLVAPAGDSPCTTSLAANSSCTIGVTFKPLNSETLLKFASLTLDLDEGFGANTLGLMGEVKGPAALVISPKEVDFGEVVVATGAPGTATKTVVVKNEGELDATLVVFSFSAPTVFAAPSGCGTTIAAGTSCTLTLSATLEAPATYTDATGWARYNTGEGTTPDESDSAILKVKGVNAAAVVLTSVPDAGAALSPSGTNPNGKVFDLNSDYPDAPVIVGSATVQSKQILITNGPSQTTGTLAITLTGNTDSFELAFGTLGAATSCKNLDGTFKKLAGGGSCIVTVNFQPANAEAAAGTDDWSLPTAGDLTTTLSVTADPGAVSPRTVLFTGHAKSAIEFALRSVDVDAVTDPINVSSELFGSNIYVRLNSTVVSNNQETGLMSLAGFPASGTPPAGAAVDSASFGITQNTCFYNRLPAVDTVCVISVQYLGGTTTTVKKATLKISDRTTGNTGSIVVQYDPAKLVSTPGDIPLP